MCRRENRVRLRQRKLHACSTPRLRKQYPELGRSGARSLRATSGSRLRARPPQIEIVPSRKPTTRPKRDLLSPIAHPDKAPEIVLRALAGVPNAIEVNAQRRDSVSVRVVRRAERTQSPSSVRGAMIVHHAAIAPKGDRNLADAPNAIEASVLRRGSVSVRAVRKVERSQSASIVPGAMIVHHVAIVRRGSQNLAGAPKETIGIADLPVATHVYAGINGQ